MHIPAHTIYTCGPAWTSHPKRSLTNITAVTVIVLVLLLSLLPLINSAQTITIALLHCLPEKKQQNEATPLVDAVFIEARRDNSRSNFALEKVVVVVVRQDFLSLNLGFLVI